MHNFIFVYNDLFFCSIDLTLVLFETENSYFYYYTSHFHLYKILTLKV